MAGEINGQVCRLPQHFGAAARSVQTSKQPKAGAPDRCFMLGCWHARFECSDHAHSAILATPAVLSRMFWGFMSLEGGAWIGGV